MAWEYVAAKDFKGINTTNVSGMTKAIDAYIAAINAYFKKAAKDVPDITKLAFVGKHRDEMNKKFSDIAASSRKITETLGKYATMINSVSKNYQTEDVNIGKTFTSK